MSQSSEDLARSRLGWPGNAASGSIHAISSVGLRPEAERPRSSPARGSKRRVTLAHSSPLRLDTAHG
jgi:hypothetical protein